MVKKILFYCKLRSFKYYMYIHFIYNGPLRCSFWPHKLHLSYAVTATFLVKIMLDSAIYKI